MAADRSRGAGVRRRPGAGDAGGDALNDSAGTRRSAAHRWALERIAEATAIPADKRRDLAFMRQAVSLAHAFAKAGLLGKDPPPPKELPGQIDLFVEPASDDRRKSDANVVGNGVVG